MIAALPLKNQPDYFPEKLKSAIIAFYWPNYCIFFYFCSAFYQKLDP